MASPTPNSTAAFSDVDPNSPGHSRSREKSYAAVVTEDEDNTKMATATPEPGDRHTRGRKRGRDEANGSIIGKIRHLKKDDGEPLWRKDIQYDFLKAIFDNSEKVFTNSYEPETIGKQCFADLYIDTMSRSTKCSKVLRDKLLSDRAAAVCMAMVCLLVNIGRMNTTLNFFPEMRAQLRTYHAIPSLQAHQDPHAYKQLQDAPRLKSILKGAAEDRVEPHTLEAMKVAQVPRTNPVNLIFTICHNAGKVAELHFPQNREFHDLIMKTNLSSESRARAFLWIMWFYLESDYTEEGCEENPFGAGVDYGVDVANQGVPRLIEMTAEEEAQENVDPEDERQFGIQKQQMRAKIIEADQTFLAESQTKRGGRGRAFAAADDTPAGVLPRLKPSKPDSDVDSVRSTPPPRAFAARQSGVTGTTRRANPLKYQVFEGSSPGAGQMIEGVVARKPRPPTAHQLAVERNRSQRTDYILDRGIRKSHHQSKKLRRKEGSLIRALNRLNHNNDPFEDSEGEDRIAHNKQALSMGNAYPEPKTYPFREKGYGGLCQLKSEGDDYGEEVAAYGAAFRRVARRLERWESHEGEDLGVIRPTKRPKAKGYGDDEDEGEGYGDGEPSPSKYHHDPAETEDETDMMMSQQRPSKAARGGGNKSNGTNGHHSHSHMEEPDDLDDVDKELLGLGDGDEDGEEADGDDGGEGEDELDEVDKTLLGMDGDSDSE
ncbi:hypothetical protein QBC39DRAFT_49142 [Podospora conica]|nr:hypothetical protein QBC39DRAFT_49142 [Schizothecium conicum]